MAWQFDVNNSETGTLSTEDYSGHMIRGLWLHLVANGWTVQGSSDGLSFENNGQTAGPFDMTTTTSVWNSNTAGDWSNLNSWVRLRDPGGTRELVIQRFSNSSPANQTVNTILISPTGFTNNDATATTAPTGADQQTVSTGFGYQNNSADSVYWHVACEDAAVNGVYAFYVFMTRQGDQAVLCGGLMETMQSIVVGDTEAWSAAFKSGATCYNFSILGSTTSGMQGFRDFGGGTELYTTVTPFAHRDPSNQTLIPGIAPQADGSERHMAPVYGNFAHNIWKGIGTNYRWKGAEARNYPDTISLATANARVIIGDMTFPWQQSVVPL